MILMFHRTLEPEGDEVGRLRRIDFVESVRCIFYHGAGIPLVVMDDFTLVAKVNTLDKEAAYRAVHNEMGRNWQQHPLMVWAAPPPQKAGTDIGDLMVDSIGGWWLVGAFGFHLVPGNLRVPSTNPSYAPPSPSGQVESIGAGLPQPERPLPEHHATIPSRGSCDECDPAGC